MIIKQIILLSILALTLIKSFGQIPTSISRGLYSVDEKVDLQVRKFSWADTDTLKNSMAIKVFWNTNTFFDQSVDCYTESFVRNDTIGITGYMIGKLGWGFELALFKDSCFATCFGLSDDKIYKYNKSDTDYMDLIMLPSIFQRITLSKKPSFQKGEIVAGSIELKSVPYYYSNLEGKFTIVLKAYFKTAALIEIQ